MLRDLKDFGGFTLLELIVVVAIFGLLAAIAIPQFSSYRDKAKIVLVRTDLRNIQRAMEMLASDTEKWPGPHDVGVTTDQEVWDLNSPQAGLVATNGGVPNWNGPYIDSAPKDPWGSDYFLDPDDKIGGIDYAVVGSFGPNKVGQNVYDSDDVFKLLPLQ